MPSQPGYFDAGHGSDVVKPSPPFWLPHWKRPAAGEEEAAPASGWQQKQTEVFAMKTTPAFTYARVAAALPTEKLGENILASTCGEQTAVADCF